MQSKREQVPGPRTLGSLKAERWEGTGSGSSESPPGVPPRRGHPVEAPSTPQAVQPQPLERSHQNQAPCPSGATNTRGDPQGKVQDSPPPSGPSLLAFASTPPSLSPTTSPPPQSAFAPVQDPSVLELSLPPRSSTIIQPLSLSSFGKVTVSLALPQACVLYNSRVALCSLSVASLPPAIIPSDFVTLTLTACLGTSTYVIGAISSSLLPSLNSALFVGECANFKADKLIIEIKIEGGPVPPPQPPAAGFLTMSPPASTPSHSTKTSPILRPAAFALPLPSPIPPPVLRPAANARLSVTVLSDLGSTPSRLGAIHGQDQSFWVSDQGEPSSGTGIDPELLLQQAGDVEMNPGPDPWALFAQGEKYGPPPMAMKEGIEYPPIDQEDEGPTPLPQLPSPPDNNSETNHTADNLTPTLDQTEDDDPYPLPGSEMNPADAAQWVADTLQAKAQQQQGREGACTAALCYIFGLDVSNKWDVLGDDMDNFPSELEMTDTLNDDNARIKKSREAKTRKSQTTPDLTDPDALLRPLPPTRNHGGAGQARVPPSRMQLDNVVQRIVRNLRRCGSSSCCDGLIDHDVHAHDDRFFAWLQKRNACRKFITLVANELWGSNWEILPQQQAPLTLTHLYCLTLSGVISDDEFVWCTIPVVLGIGATAPYLARKPYAAIICQKLLQSKDLLVSGDYSRYLQESHNQRMHALNGNPDFPGDMAALDSRPTDLKSYISKARAVASNTPPVSGSNLLARVTLESSGTNRTADHSLRHQMNIFAETVQRDGTRRQNTALPLPATTLIPRNVRPAAPGALVVARQPMPVSGFSLSTSRGRKLEITQRGSTVIDKVDNSASSNWRYGSTTIEGYLNGDLYTIAQSLPQDGMSLEAPMLRLVSLHSILAHRSQVIDVPETIYTAFDTNTRPTDARATIGINDSPVPGETCGGYVRNAQYPYLGGRGNLSFHLTLDTVPREDIPYAIFFPPCLIDAQRDRVNRSLALFILSISEWPFCLFTVSQASQDANGGNAANQIYMPLSTTTRIPGPRTLRVVLPRHIFSQVPNNPAGIARASIFQPQFGPDPAIFPVAGRDILVSQAPDGAGLHEVALVQYLMSWALAFSLDDIKRTFYAYRSFTGSEADSVSAWEMARLANTVFPALIMSNSPSLTDYTPNTDTFRDCNLGTMTRLPYAGNSTAAPPVAGQWPQAYYPPATFVGWRFGHMAWNGMTLGIYKQASVAVPPSHDPTPLWLAQGTAVAQQIIGAAQVAVGPQLLFSLYGFSSELVDNVVNGQARYDAAIRAIMRLYCTHDADGTFVPSAFGHLQECILQHAAGAGHFGYMYDGSMLSPFGRQLRPTAVATINDDQVRVDLMPPAVLVTGWLAFLSNELPIQEAPFCSSGGVHGVGGYDKKTDPTLEPHYATIAGARRSTTFISRPDTKNMYTTSTTPDDSFRAIYNMKLVQTSYPNRHYGDQSGAALPGVNPPPNALMPKQRPMPLPGACVRPTQDADALIGSLPRVCGDGARVFIYVTADNIQREIFNCEHRNGSLMRAALAIGSYIYHSLDADQSDEPSNWDSIASDFRPRASAPTGGTGSGASTSSAPTTSP
ncbi:hypothetical protein 1 [Wenzhou toti-like virus 1]|uniref:Uncharacterized protein n=1 Tax=Wenzhou toti-like virus 1 TaxID=1923680 RepID=A0A1L3KF67_9VIRU|nr:hypothetical protein 1 [Wenzhou toti-like virus 1]APG76070.1 hypothetical protein 1 [Wenzhou toti-like virus 1]